MITLDIETYYAADYSLSARGKNAMTIEEYIRDPRFLLHGIGIKYEASPAKWYTRARFEANLDKFRTLFAQDICLGHNTMFDAAALSWHYKCKFGVLLDTLSMARPVIGVDASASLAAVS